MKQDFDLDIWLQDKSRKVVTRDGRAVRILCTDAKAKDGCCIIAAIETDGEEEGYQFFKDGKAYSSKSSIEDCADLFFADEEEELTEFEKELYTSYICIDVVRQNYNKEEVESWVKTDAPNLLELARNELLKDLPKWKRSNYFFNTGNKFELGKTLLRRFDGYEIPYSELEKLPKEEL